MQAIWFSFGRARGAVAKLLRKVTGSQRLFIELEHSQKHLQDVVCSLQVVSTQVAQLRQDLMQLRDERNGFSARLDPIANTVQALSRSMESAQPFEFPNAVEYADTANLIHSKWASRFESISNLLPHVSSDDSVLEVSCGVGKGLSWQAITACKQYIGIDSSELLLDSARHINRKDNVKFSQRSNNSIAELQSKIDLALYCDEGYGWSFGDLQSEIQFLAASLRSNGKLLLVLSQSVLVLSKMPLPIEKVCMSAGLSNIQLHNCSSRTEDLTVLTADRLHG